MTWQDLLEHCLAKPGAWQDQPWEDDVVVKVGPKIFAFFGPGPGDSIGLTINRSDPSRRSRIQISLKPLRSVMYAKWAPSGAQLGDNAFHGRGVA